MATIPPPVELHETPRKCVLASINLPSVVIEHG